MSTVLEFVAFIFAISGIFLVLYAEGLHWEKKFLYRAIAFMLICLFILTVTAYQWFAP